MSNQRAAIRAFFSERIRGVIGITVLALSISAAGYLCSIFVVWLLA